MAAIFLFFVPGRRRYRAMFGLWLICLVSFAMGCGGSSGGGGVGTAALPTFNPGAGTYASAQSVTITSATGGATICYTTNGTTPAATSPGTCSTGTTLANGGAVSVAVSETLEAIATESGLNNSGVASAAYTIAPPTTTKITAPVTKAASGAALSFNVAVTATSSGMPAGNGNVQLLDGGNVVTTVAAVNGVAAFNNITTLSVGTHAISAHYLGDASTGASQSGNVNVTVTGQTTVGIATNPASSNNNVTISLTVN
ncbi:MAG TPA: Ig-like domain repeat protein [Mycobacterium sp.]|nr:Ig-like domain repeat protein [Mycobacterium sp.]